MGLGAEFVRGEGAMELGSKVVGHGVERNLREGANVRGAGYRNYTPGVSSKLAFLLSVACGAHLPCGAGSSMMKRS